MRPVGLRCEYFEAPLGVDTARPRLSWRLASNRRGARQTAYRVRVASSPEKLASGDADLWDSGRRRSDQTAHVEYAGKTLQSRQRCHWQVTSWDERGDAVESARATWEMGLLEPRDWRARWLQHGPKRTREPRPAAHFRRDFRVGPGLVAARLYASALGLYTAHIDGARVGDHELAPGWTDFNKRLHYQVFDVTNAVGQGDHAIGLTLADGWFAGYIAWLERGSYGTQPAVIAQLELDYADGRRDVVATDGSWRSATGPITSTDLLMGESHDARLELRGWDEPGYGDGAWAKAKVMPRPRAVLQWQPGPPVRRVDEIPARRVTRAPGGGQIFDLGQNMVGRVRLTIRGKAGTLVQLRHAEMLHADGSLMTENLRRARATDTYTLRGGRAETWEPVFTQHGFRYVEVTGHPGELPLSAVTGVVLQSDTPTTGAFRTSHRLLNKLQHNIEWGQRGNFVHIPTDCPQRDERMGWMGDAQVFAGTACFNADVAAFFTKWLQDVRDSQGPSGAFPDVAPDPSPSEGAPAWGDAGTIVPWVAYERYADRRILQDQLAAMERWVAYIKKANPDLLWRNQLNNNYGDWLSVGADTDKEVLATAYFARSADLTARSAEVLGKQGKARRYRELFEDIRGAFNHEFVDTAGHVRGRTQTAYVIALAFDLLPAPMRPKALRHLVRDIEKHDGHLTTGFVGVSHLLPVLSEGGREDVAFRLLEQETFPSWLYPVLQGATTIWERWDSWKRDGGFQDAGMNSFNHYAFGSVGDWMYANIGGVAPAAPGYKRILVAPRIGGTITSASAELQAMHGPIAVSWRRHGPEFSMNVTIPANTTAEIHVPARSLSSVTEGGRSAASVDGLSNGKWRAGAARFEAVSGSYRFRSVLKA
jgi:alpha-L-rhamnosidase